MNQDQPFKEITRSLATELGFKNPHAGPRLEKITLNCGTGRLTADQVEALTQHLALITGQKPVTTLAKRAIASFKIRKRQPVGLTLTLRGKRMYDFFKKLVWVCLPGMRDFRGIDKKTFDGHGNLTIGINDLSIFPELRGDIEAQKEGLQISLSTRAQNDEAGYALFKALGLPLK